MRKAGIKITHSADDILGRISFSAEEKDVEVVFVWIKDFDFNVGGYYNEVCRKAKDLGMDLCPAELGPQLRLQCRKEINNGTWVVVAMEPIADEDGKLKLFRIGRFDNCLWLSTDYGEPDSFCGGRYAFILNK